MPLGRLIITVAICGGLAYYLGSVVIKGLASGRIQHSDSSSVCIKSVNPMRYWLLVLLFTVMVLGSVFMVGKTLYEFTAN